MLGQKSKAAEHLYKYISQNDEFKEAHTGLEDVLIESEILLACLRSHKKMNRNIVPMPWRIPQSDYKEYKTRTA